MNTQKILVAIGGSNWDYYVTTLSDGNSCLLSIAKKDSGASDSVWCSVKNLKSHLKHLANIKHGANWDSIIPDDWQVVNHEFFKQLAIY